MVQFEAAPNAPEQAKVNPLLKIVLELGPLVVFFFANARGAWLAEKFPFLAGLTDPSRPGSEGLFVATALFIVTTILALSISYALTRKLPIMPLVSGIVVLVFGGLTLVLQNETFIKMKPTIVNGLFAAVLLGGLLFGKSLVGYVFNSVFQLTDEGWRKLTFRWGIFFVVLAVLNEVVWRAAPSFVGADLSPEEATRAANDIWVNFKVFGIMPLTILFTMTQLPLIMREQVKPASETSQ
jgi:intracellular septation protein